MKQASKAPRPFIKCSQYLKPVSVSVSAYLSIRNFKCLIAAGANHYSIPYNKGSYHSTILLREVTAVSNILTYSHFTQTGPARIYLIIMRPQLPFPWSHTLITHAVPVPVWETEHTYLFLSLFQCEHSTDYRHYREYGCRMEKEPATSLLPDKNGNWTILHVFFCFFGQWENYFQGGALTRTDPKVICQYWVLIQ